MTDCLRRVETYIATETNLTNLKELNSNASYFRQEDALKVVAVSTNFLESLMCALTKPASDLTKDSRFVQLRGKSPSV